MVPLLALLLGASSPQPTAPQVPRTEQAPPGLKFTLALCPDSHLTRKDVRRVTTAFRMAGHRFTRPVVLDECYDGLVPGYIYIDTVDFDLLNEPETLGIADISGPPGWTLGGIILLDDRSNIEVLKHEVAHILGYDHSESGLMAPRMRLGDTYTLEGLSVWGKKRR